MVVEQNEKQREWRTLSLLTTTQIRQNKNGDHHSNQTKLRRRRRRRRGGGQQQAQQKGTIPNRANQEENWPELKLIKHNATYLKLANIEMQFKIKIKTYTLKPKLILP